MESEASVATTRRADTSDYLLELGPYDEDDIQVLRFELVERLSVPFELRVEISSRDLDLDFEAVIGERALMTLKNDHGERFVHGICNRFEQVAQTQRHAYYELTIVPKLWLLSQRQDCRIFQELTIDEIVRQVLVGHGLTEGDDFRFELTDPHPEREYCVQYRESDLDFCQRLLEEEGVFYFVEHTAEKSVLVMADSPASYEPISGDVDVRYFPPSGMVDEREQVTEWRVSKQIRPGAVQITDYEFKQPTLDLKSSAHGNKDTTLEVYDFPGEYVDPSVGQQLARVRLQELEAARLTAKGRSNCMRFGVGLRFELDDHPREDFNRSYMITEATHRGTHPAALEEDNPFGAADADEIRYRNDFQVIPSEVVYRPPRETERPVVKGVQTAMVVGPPGEEIYVDNFSRVKVQFHWDRLGGNDEKSSCWIRVSQPWAGKGWGGLAIPRIGQEVIIDFLEGDPDRPIMTGRVYNGDSMPPQPLPGAKANMTIRSDSLGGGGGSNEITMNDTGGDELFYMHAQYNLDEVVENDRTKKVGMNETTEVGVDRTTTVKNNETQTIGVDRTEDVGSNETQTIGANRSHTIGANDTLTVGANRSVTVGSNQTTTVSISSNELVGAAKTVTVGGAHALSVGAAANTAVGLSSTEEVGLIKKVIAGKSIELECGSASIKLESGGTITIKGTKLHLEASGPVTINGSVIDLN